jgi:transketolase
MAGRHSWEGFPEKMTRQERTDLITAAKLRARTAKAHTAKLKAERLADFEEQLATEYDPLDERWAEAVKEASAAAKASEEKINARIAEQLPDVPERFRPSVQCDMAWRARGENFLNERRVELRRVATTRLDQLAKKALAAIEERTNELQIHLLSGGSRQKPPRCTSSRFLKSPS